MTESISAVMPITLTVVFVFFLFQGRQDQRSSAANDLSAIDDMIVPVVCRKKYNEKKKSAECFWGPDFGYDKLCLDGYKLCVLCCICIHPH